jgi:cell division protein ZapA (FtsZ GTPase activity inhibitor)
MSKKSVAVRIAGHEYKILTEGDGDGLRQIAKDVDRAMARVRERTGTVDTLDVAVLTCLNLAREIIDLKDRPTELASDDRLRGLIHRVEELLPQALRSAIDDESTGSAAETEAKNSSPTETPRTLDLPSVEALLERSSSRTVSSADHAGSSMPEPRVAAGGGRERAS